MQADLFEPAERPRARRSDRATSHEAAERSHRFSKKHSAAIFSWLLAHPQGQTYREIATGTKLEPVAVGRRLKELCLSAGVYADGVRDRMTIWRIKT